MRAKLEPISVCEQDRRKRRHKSVEEKKFGESPRLSGAESRARGPPLCGTRGIPEVREVRPVSHQSQDPP